MEALSNQDIIEAIVAEWKRPLGLSDWRISIRYGGIALPDGDDPPAMAQVEDRSGARLAVIRVFENWNVPYGDRPLCSLTEVLVHELLHLVVGERKLELETEEWLCDRFALLLRNAEKKGEAEGRRQIKERKIFTCLLTNGKGSV